MSSDLTKPDEPGMMTEALWALTYFVIYLVYLSFSLENEFLHWFSLVIIPFSILFCYQSIKGSSWNIRASLSTVGLEKQGRTESSGRS